MKIEIQANDVQLGSKKNTDWHNKIRKREEKARYNATTKPLQLHASGSTRA